MYNEAHMTAHLVNKYFQQLFCASHTSHDKNLLFSIDINWKWNQIIKKKYSSIIDIFIFKQTSKHK